MFEKPVLGPGQTLQPEETVDLLKDIRPGAGAGVHMAAVGPEDAFMTLKPSYSHFKASYKTHTPFAINHTEQYFSGGFKLGRTNVAPIPLAGDLLRDAWVELTLPALPGAGTGGTWIPYVGLAVVKEWRLVVGETVVQTVPRDWTYVTSRLRAGQKHEALKEMVGGGEPLSVSAQHTLYVPVPFFFGAQSTPSGPRTPFPIAAVSNASFGTPLHIEVVTERIEHLVSLTTPPTSPLPTSLPATLLLDYVLLGELERASVIAFGHRLLIRSIETSESPAYLISSTTGDVVPTSSVQVSLDAVNKAVATLVVLAKEENEGPKRTFFNYKPIRELDLFLTSQKRFQTRPGTYFSTVIPYAHAHAIPPPGTHIHLYPFTLPGSQSFENAGHVDLTAFKQPNVRASGIQSSDPLVLVLVLAEVYNFLTMENGYAQLDRVA